MYRGSFLVLKRPGFDFDHSPKSNAELKNEWSFASALRPSIYIKCGTCLLLRCFVTLFEGVMWKVQVGLGVVYWQLFENTVCAGYAMIVYMKG